MKKIFRKNQLVITALALMIAVAGYFSYMNSNVDDDAAAEASSDFTVEDYEISDEDAILEGEIFTDEGTGEELAIVDGTETASTDGTDVDVAAVEGQVTADGAEVTDAAETSADGTAAQTADATGATDVENPGEAVLTSSTVTNLDYAAEMKLNREQVRSKNKEVLMEIVNSTSIDESLKQDAINKMIAMTDITEREAAAEMLLEAKGFSDVVVSITDDNCDVVLNMGEVTDAKRAQVEDIVKRKTNISAENIIITPIVVNEAETD